MGSHEPHERGGTSPADALSGRVSGNEVWWNAFKGSETFALRPLSNFGTGLVTESAPGPTGSQSRAGHTRRRPPALDLDHISNKPRNDGCLSGSTISPAFSLEECEPDPRSPWNMLKAFPSPPSSPLVIQGSRTSRSLSKILRRGGNVPDVPVPMPGTPKCSRKERPGRQDENVPPTPRQLKKGHSSLGSLGKAFRTTPASVPSTPLPIPAPWMRPDQSSDKEVYEPKVLSNSHRRNTFKSKLFSIATSPKAGDGPDRKPLTPIQPRPHYIRRREIRMVSCSPGDMATAQGDKTHNGSRSRSVSQPVQTKAKRNKAESVASGVDSTQWIGRIDVEKQLIIPERRTRSPSYINLYVPPWRQASLSPTQTSFAGVGGMMSAPTTPLSAAFVLLPDEAMHLPASRSVRSLRAEVDPFGAGEPASFFRSEYGKDWDTDVTAGRDTLDFYRGIADIEASRRRRGRQPRRQPTKPHRVPEIVVSSSTGLRELKKRNWVLTG